MIIVRLQGGLGNQMFQYALGRVLAIKNKTDLILNTQAYDNKSPRLRNRDFNFRTYDLDVFNIAGRVAEGSEIPFIRRMHGTGRFALLIDAIKRRIFRHRAQEFHFKKFNPTLLELGQGAYLDGFFQSYKYFSGYEEVLLKDFTLKEAMPEHTEILKNEILSLDSLCVFVRRKDFVGNKYYEVVGKDYYSVGLDRIIKKGNKVDKIYVFSDDIKWCRENLEFEIETMFVGDEYAGPKWAHHMMLMSCCKYFLVPNSTFSWWPAWLSKRTDKIVVLPNRWVGDALANMDDIAPKDWIRI